jgi:hypothetical protein
MTNSDESKRKVKIWDVLEGPIPTDFEVGEDPHFNLCKVEVGGKIEQVEYEMVKHFHTSIEPIEFEDDY